MDWYKRYWDLVDEKADGQYLVPIPQQAVGYPVTAYDYNSNIVGTSNATVVSGNFETDMSSSGYMLSCSQGQSETFDLRYTIKINGGPEREIRPYSGTHLEIYNGFRVLPPMAIEVKNDPFVVAGQFISLLAVIYPNPALNAGFSYEWFAVKVGGGPGEGIFNQEGVPSNMTRFSASCPGDYNVSCRVTFNGETETSGYLKIKVGPEIFIDNPLEDNQKYCFNQNGELVILAEGHTNPEESGEDLIWDISPIEGTNLTTDPGDRQGTIVEFDLNGLPLSNDEFGDNNGNNWIKASLPIEDCVVEQKKPIVLFYPKDRYNHGGGNPDEVNWFHYWKQGCVPGLSEFLFSKDYGGGSYKFVWLDSHGNPVEDLRVGILIADAYDFNAEFPYLDLPGNIVFEPVNGIDNASVTCSHELLHKWFHHQWMPPNGVWYLAYGEHPAIFFDPLHPNLIPNPNDIDGDLIPDAAEISYNNEYGLHLDPLRSDTYNLAAYCHNEETARMYRRYGDQELLCYILSREARGDESKDWSHGEYSKNWPND